MTKPQKLAALMPLIRLAADQAATLPPVQRADLFEGVHLITAGLDRSMSEQARLAAQALRDAEGHQLTFAALLRQTNQATAPRS